jgi:hypothetical protein
MTYRAFLRFAAAMTPPLPETSTVRLLSFNESGKFYILSDGKHRFFADARHFPNGLSTGELVTFTIQATQKGKLPEIEKVIFAPEAAR